MCWFTTLGLLGSQVLPGTGLAIGSFFWVGFSAKRQNATKLGVDPSQDLLVREGSPRFISAMKSWPFVRSHNPILRTTRITNGYENHLPIGMILQLLMATRNPARKNPSGMYECIPNLVKSMGISTTKLPQVVKPRQDFWLEPSTEVPSRELTYPPKMAF